VRNEYQSTDNAVLEDVESEPDFLGALLGSRAPDNAGTPVATGMIVGELVALVGERREPLLVYEGTQAARIAKSIVDLHKVHIGKSVLIGFERGLVDRPVVIGVLVSIAGWPIQPQPAQVTVEADGTRLLIEAEREMTLRCGTASITMTSDGRITLRGTQVVSHAEGANRIRGGSVELN
jgi:Domain of unknown function (DUF6484)